MVRRARCRKKEKSVHKTIGYQLLGTVEIQILEVARDVLTQEERKFCAGVSWSRMLGEKMNCWRIS